MQGSVNPESIRGAGVTTSAPLAAEGAIRKRPGTQCFHRFVDKVKPGLMDFKLLNPVGKGAFGCVYAAKCTTDRRCDVAIKVVPLNRLKDLNKSGIELRALELIKNTPHENIIEYFGFFDETEKRYLVFELADCNLRQYLDKAIPALSPEQFNEIAFQFLNALDYLNEMQLFHDDYKLENMVFCSSDRKIKLIDFEQTRVPSDKYYLSPLEPLKSIGRFLGEIELLMVHQAENDRFFSSVQKFTHAWLKGDFSRSEAMELEKEEPIWHQKLSGKTRNLVALCFVRDETVRSHVVNERHSLIPRQPLMLIDELSPQGAVEV